MSKSTITLSDDAHAIAVYASVAGKTTETELVEQVVHAGTENTERKVRQTIANIAQHKEATTLVNSLRALVARFSTNVEPLGNITDSKRLAEFMTAAAEVEKKIEAHNEVPGQLHPIKHDVLTLPIGRVLDERSQKRLCATMTESLTEARDMLKKGDVAGVRYWLQHRKNLAGLMPPIVARPVEDAIMQIGEQCKRVAKLIKAGERSATEAGSLAETDQIEIALTWVDTSLTGVTESGEAVQ